MGSALIYTHKNLRSALHFDESLMYPYLRNRQVGVDEMKVLFRKLSFLKLGA